MGGQETIPATDGHSRAGRRGWTERLPGIRGIAARKRTEDALRNSRVLLEKTFASLKEAVFVVEPSSRTIIACNPAAERIFGHTQTEMVGRTTEFLHVNRATYEEFGGQLFPALAANGVFHTKYQMRRKDGVLLVTDHTVTEIVDDSGHRTELISVVRDITDSKRAEEALRDSEERLRSTANAMMEGCQIIGLDWRYLFVNDAAAKHGRRTKEELLGRTMMEMYPGIQDTGIFAHLKRCMEERIPHSMETEFTYPDGSKAWFEIRIQAVPEGIFVLSLEISERKRAEEALLEAREELEGKVERQLLRRNPYGLTFRELTVLHLVAAGQSDREIGGTLVISHLTAQKHISNILAKMGAASRTEASVRAVREGLLD